MDEQEVPSESRLTLPDWLHKYHHQNFAWGISDCAQFGVGWIENLTGIDYLNHYRPWSSAREAVKILHRAGGFETLFNQHLTHIHSALANDGDITILDGAASIFSGRHIVSLGQHGLIFQSRSLSYEAWSCRS